MASKTPLTVYSGKHEPGCYNWSPFVNKLEARLRFANVSYRVEAGSMTEAPRGKIPYIRVMHDRSDGTGLAAEAQNLLGDSTLIINYLTETERLPRLNSSLAKVQKVQDMALRALMEEKMYFLQVWERWTVSENFYVMRDQGPLAPIPYPIRVLVGMIVYRKIVRTLQGQGTAKYSADEINNFCIEGYAAINDMLDLTSNGDKQGSIAATTGGKEPFWAFGGSEPTEFDATLYGFLSSVLVSSANPKTQAAIRKHAILVDYAERIHEKYFPDYEKWRDFP